MAAKWVMRWRYEVSAKPVLPGVWRRKEGGFVVRGRAVDPAGRKREVIKVLDSPTADEARGVLRAELERVRRPPSPATPKPKTRFDAYATSLLARRVDDGTIRSAATRQKWGNILEKHLYPAFGARPVEDLRRAELLSWRDEVAKKIKAGTYAPTTAVPMLDAMPLRCQHYRVTSRDGAPLAVRCRRRGRWRVQLARSWVVCSECLPDVVSLQRGPVVVVAIEGR